MRRDIEIDLARRTLHNFQAGTTDQAPDVMRLPVAAYTDEVRYQRESQHIFKQLPQGVALSIELPSRRCYRALTVLGVPVLLVRDDDGKARAFLNVCRHRGAKLCENGHGKARVFTCPYHAWSYDRQGKLIGRYGAETFGDVDVDNMGLTVLPCAERAGLIWVVLDPSQPLDIDDWLGDFADELASLRLNEWQIHTQRELDGPGWKVCMDGYLEAYHHKFVHAKTIGGLNTISNLLVHDTYGPHQRLTFGRESVSTLEGQEESEWEPMEHIRIIHSCFPNLSLSGILGGFCLMSQIYPGEDATTTKTRQTILVHAPDGAAYDNDAADEFSALALEAVNIEDYPIGFGIQSGIESGANSHFTFGRNECGLQHYHEWVQHFMTTAQDGSQAKGPAMAIKPL